MVLPFLRTRQRTAAYRMATSNSRLHGTWPYRPHPHVLSTNISLVGKVVGVILPSIRDPRLTTIRRGGSLRDEEHRLLALWAADCAVHVPYFFENSSRTMAEPRTAIALTRARARREIHATPAK